MKKREKSYTTIVEEKDGLCITTNYIKSMHQVSEIVDAQVNMVNLIGSNKVESIVIIDSNGKAIKGKRLQIPDSLKSKK